MAKPSSRPRAGVVYTLAAIAPRLFLHAILRRRYSGTENLPKSGGFIAAANHVTELDSITFMHFMLHHHYPVRVLVKSSLMKVHVVGFCARKSKMIPVYRETSAAADSLRDAKAALRAGECVGIFPEGTLTRDPGLWPMKGRTGAARMALDTGAPVIPIAQWGAHRTLEPYGKWHLQLFRRGLVEVSAGPAVDLSDLHGRAEDHEAVEEATRRIMEALTKQLRGLRPGETPPAKVWDMKVDQDRYHREKKKK